MDNLDIAMMITSFIAIVLAFLFVAGFSALVAYLLAYGIATITAVEYSTGLFALCLAITLLLGIMIG